MPLPLSIPYLLLYRHLSHHLSIRISLSISPSMVVGYDILYGVCVWLTCYSKWFKRNHLLSYRGNRSSTTFFGGRGAKKNCKKSFETISKYQTFTVPVINSKRNSTLLIIFSFLMQQCDMVLHSLFEFWIANSLGSSGGKTFFAKFKMVLAL